MVRKLHIILIFSFLSLCFANFVEADNTVVLNKYAEVKEIYNYSRLNVDSVVVDDTTGFRPRDTVIIYQAKGIDWNYTVASSGGFYYGGTFEYLLIDTIIKDTIIFKSSLSYINDVNKYKSSCSVQLIKVPSFKKLTLSKKLQATAWNGKKGGVVALIADSIDLEANIDVSGQGFLGADPSKDVSSATCVDTTTLRKGNFSSNSQDTAGLKGEGAVIFDDLYLRGQMPLGNGGGGGNGFHSGGGGGGNWGAGGIGGDESSQFGCHPGFKYTGGQKTFAFGLFMQSETKARVFFGGGGGASRQKTSYVASKGGNGGGAVIIMANVFKGNGKYILADGQSVTSVATAGGGGGGAGGSILLDISQFSDSLYLSVQGGNGGNTIGSYNPGAGGGGGGGYLISSSTGLPGYVLLNPVPGDHGMASSGWLPATSGGSGGSKFNLVFPLNAFLYNIMPESQDICAGETPQKLIASQPKGGKGPGTYTFRWIQSADSYIWDTVGYSKDYQPGILNATTFYRRIVKSGTAVDTSTMLTIKVWPKITNNIISFNGNDTICTNSAFPLLKSGSLSGGNGHDYKFLWQDSTTSWLNAPGTNDTSGYKSERTSTTGFRRIVTSGVCVDTSNVKVLTVLPPISNNQISSSQWVSQDVTPAPLTGAKPLGGDTIYKYLWQKSSNSSVWINADNSNNQKDYIIPRLLDTLYFRRIVFSGHYNSCKDTSNAVFINVLDSLTNNTITGTATICGKTKPNDFTGTKPKGGDKISYNYKWEKSSDGNIWNALALVTNGDTTFNPGILDTTTYFRRIVFSGPSDCSKDTSNTIKVSVIPYIKNNNIVLELTQNTDTTICQNQTPGNMKGSVPYDGQAPYKFLWQYSSDQVKWDTVSGNFSNPDYLPTNLTSSAYFRKEVIAGVCSDFSNTVKVIVLPSIKGNNISSDAFICKGTAPNIQGKQLTGGANSTYSYEWYFSNDSSVWLKDTSVVTGNYQDSALKTRTFYRRIVKSGPFNCCIDSSNIISINIFPLPTAVLKDTSDTICKGKESIMHVNLTGKTPFSIQYSDGVSSFVSNNITSLEPTLNVKPENDAAYKLLSVVDGNQCKASEISGIQKVKVYEVPKADAGNDTSVCGLAAILNARPSIGKGLWSSDVSSVFSDSSQNKVRVEVKQYGNIVFTWTERNGVCFSSDKVQVLFYQKPDTAYAGIDQVEPFLFMTNLKALKPAVGTGKWTSLTGEPQIEDTTSAETHVTNIQFGKNNFVWTVTNGVCPSISDTVIINATDLKIPEGFSPNGDSINDVFEIKGLNRVTGAQLIIINKWGKEVYSSENYLNDWDGSANGTPLSEDTYFYVLNVIGRTYKGIVYIKR